MEDREIPLFRWIFFVIWVVVIGGVTLLVTTANEQMTTPARFFYSVVGIIVGIMVGWFLGYKRLIGLTGMIIIHKNS